MRFRVCCACLVVLLAVASCQLPPPDAPGGASAALDLPLQETTEPSATPDTTSTPDGTNPTLTSTPGPQAFMPLIKQAVTLVPTITPTPSLTPIPPFDPSRVQLQLELLQGNLNTPVGITHAGDGSGRLFVIEKPGTIRIVQNGVLNPSAFLDIHALVKSDAFEQGLLGLAFHPRYKDNGYFYVNYTDLQGDTVIARFTVSDDMDRADPNSAVPILTLDQPYDNHNGGHLVFGPDGYLWIGTGDGGRGGDPLGNAQRTSTLFGKLLRINVDQAQPYSIPPDNPFVGQPAFRPEIWAYGLRNPWRFSFDRLTRDLYIADVGQDLWEEVNFSPAGAPGGANYGWNRMEGSHCYPPAASCSTDGLTLPVTEYPHGPDCSVTGGHVYRGQAYPVLRGAYLFGDFCTGRIWSLHRDTSGSWTRTELLLTGRIIASFGEDEQGEIYLVDYVRGTLWRLVGTPR